MSKNNNTEVWTLENSNICFRYTNRRYSQDVWWMVIPLIICATLILMGFLEMGILNFAFLCIVISFVIVVCCLAHTDKKNEKTEEDIIRKLLCDKIKSDAVKYGDDIKTVHCKYQIDTKGTYDIITGRCLIVLLSNDKVLEYNVGYHKPEGEIPLYYEVFVEPAESTSPEHLKAIHKRRLMNYIKKPSEKARLTLWILTIIIFGLCVFFLGIYLVETYKWNLLILIIVYLILYTAISYYIQNKKNKVTDILSFVIDLPFAIIYLALRCTLPALSILMGFLFMAIFALGIPLVIMSGIGFFSHINFTHPTYIFVTVSVATILCAHYSKFMHDLVSKYTPLRDKGEHEYQKLSLDLALYVLHKKNITFLIYLAYFAFMAITGFKQIQYNTYFISSEIDAAVTMAFLLFIAYTNMISKSLEIDVNHKELLDKIIRLLLSRDKQQNE